MPPGASQGSMSLSRKRSRSSSDSGPTYYKRRYPSSKRMFRELTLGTRPYQFKRMGGHCELTTFGGTPTYTDQSGASSCSVGPANTDDFNGIQFGFSQFFKLNSVQGVSDFGNLFDQYKIDKVVLRCMFQSNAVGLAQDTNLAGGKSGVLPILYYTPDYDDVTVPTNQTTVQQFAAAKSRVLNANEEFTITLRPKVARQVYQQGIASGYEVARSARIDNNYPDVEHYGIKYWVRNWFGPTVDNTNNCKLTIQPTYYLSMYNIR